MTDVLLYWRDYEPNWMKQFAAQRAWHWHSNAKVLGSLERGDHLWLIASGKSLKDEAERAGFLVAIWKVTKAVTNPGNDPAYPIADYAYRVLADEDGSVVFEHPIPVDHLLRPLGRDKSVGIGRFLQGPRKLSDEKLRLLKAAAGPDLALKWLTGK
jgi:hypothetical protein